MNLLEYAPYTVLAFLGIFIIAFVAWYLIPAIKLRSQLSQARSKIRQMLSVPNRRDTLTPQSFQQCLEGTSFVSLWDEYRETIHEQVLPDGARRYRATIQACQMFSAQSVIETRLNHEFFKHLPGILTGLGILGTFAGLIRGLEPLTKKGALSVDVNAPQHGQDDNIQNAVGSLLNHVSEAFWISAIAIGSAMFITAVEKWLYTLNIKLLDDLCESIDEAFQLGVGEEYLSQLVRAAEGTYDKTRQLKDALIEDLKSLLENVTLAQVKALEASSRDMRTSLESNNKALGMAISESIVGTLKEPLDKMANTAQTVSGDQSQNVQALMATVLQDFMHRLEGTFGQQFQGMDSMMVGLTRTLEDTRRSMEETVVHLRSAGTRSVDEMGRSVQELLNVVREQQLGMQKDSQEALKSLLRDLQEGQKAVIDAMQEKGRSIEHASSSAVATMGQEVTKISGGIEQALSRMERAVSELSQQIRDSGETNREVVKGLNQGAENIQRAAQGISGAWNATEQTITRSNASIEAIRQSTEALVSSIEGMKRIHGSQLESMAKFQSLLEDAKNTTLLSATARQDLQNMVSTLSEATGDYISKVPQSLEDNFEKFTSGMVANVNRTQGELDKVWNGILGNLGALLQDIEGFLEKASVESARGRN